MKIGEVVAYLSVLKLLQVSLNSNEKQKNLFNDTFNMVLLLGAGRWIRPITTILQEYHPIALSSPESH